MDASEMDAVQGAALGRADIEKYKSARLSRARGDVAEDDVRVGTSRVVMDEAIGEEVIQGVEGEEQIDVRQVSREEAAALEPFNLAAEMRDGFFDENGNYVMRQNKRKDFDGRVRMVRYKRKRGGDDAESDEEEDEEDDEEDDNDEEDAWADQLKTEAALQIEQVMDYYADDGGKGKGKDKVQEEAPAGGEIKAADLIEMQRDLVEALRRRETPLAALRRLGEVLKQERIARRKAGGGAKNGAPSEAQAIFDRITEAADALLSHGRSTVYQSTREKLEDELENLERRRVRWRYKFALEGEGDEYGPFSARQMHEWKAGGFFSGERKVFVSPVGEEAWEGAEGVVFV